MRELLRKYRIGPVEVALLTALVVLIVIELVWQIKVLTR
jgi:hypothetical protein